LVAVVVAVAVWTLTGMVVAVVALEAWYIIQHIQ
jgi:hypothetical protein